MTKYETYQQAVRIQDGAVGKVSSAMMGTLFNMAPEVRDGLFREILPVWEDLASPARVGDDFVAALALQGWVAARLPQGEQAHLLLLLQEWTKAYTQREDAWEAYNVD